MGGTNCKTHGLADSMGDRLRNITHSVGTDSAKERSMPYTNFYTGAFFLDVTQTYNEVITVHRPQSVCILLYHY